MTQIIKNTLKTILLFSITLMLSCSKQAEEVTTTFDRANNLVGIWKVTNIDPSESNCNFNTIDNSLYYFSSDKSIAGNKIFQYSYSFSASCWGSTILANSTPAGGSGVLSGNYTLSSDGTEITINYIFAGLVNTSAKIIIYSMTADKMVWLVLKNRTSISQVTLSRTN